MNNKFAWWDVVAYACPRCAASIRRETPDLIGDDPIENDMEAGCDLCGAEGTKLFPVADVNE